MAATEHVKLGSATRHVASNSKDHSVKKAGYMPKSEPRNPRKGICWTAPASSVEVPGHQAFQGVDAPSSGRA